MKRQCLSFVIFIALLSSNIDSFGIRLNARGLFATQTLATSPAASIAPPALLVAKMSAAGVTDGDLLTFISSYPTSFSLTAQAIITLRGMGVSDTVTTAMLKHDWFLSHNLNAKPPIPLMGQDTQPPILLPWELSRFRRPAADV